MLLETAGWRVFWGLTSERQTKSAAEMTVATCSNLGFKKPLSLSPDALHHTHFNSKGLKREVADAWTCFCVKFVVPLQRGEMRWVVFAMVNGLDLLRHAKTQFAFSELFLKMFYFSVLALTCAMFHSCTLFDSGHHASCFYTITQNNSEQSAAAGAGKVKQLLALIISHKPLSGAVESRNSRQRFAQARCNTRLFHWRWYEFDFCLTALNGPLRSRDDRVFFHHFDPQTPTLAAARPPWGHSKNRSNSITGITLCIVFLFGLAI